MATLQNWLDEVLEQADGCPQEVALRALERAGREFFRDSTAWIDWITGLDVTPNTSIDLNSGAPTGTQVAYAFFATLLDSGGKRYVLRPMNGYPIPAPDPVDYPTNFVLDGYSTLTVVPDVKSAKTGELDVLCALMPLDRNTVLPDQSFDHYHEAILSGALGKLMSTTDRPYTNLELAKFHLNRFRVLIARFRDEARKRYGIVDQMVAFPVRGWAKPYGTRRFSGWG